MDIFEALLEAEQSGTVSLDCGCVVEPDGEGPCGNQSPLVQQGLI
jgi:hypothetical protein